MAVFDSNHNNSNNNISNDITVRCRVRRTIPVEESRDPIPNHLQYDNPINNNNDRHNSVSSLTPSTTPFIEMTCTMRNWEKQYPNRSSSNVRMRSASCDTRSEQQLHQQQSSISSLFRNSLLLTKSDTVTTLNATGNNATNLCNDGPELYFFPIVYPSNSDISPCKSSRLLHVSRRISPASKSLIKSSSVSSLAQSPKSSSLLLQEANEVEPFSIPMEEILHVTIYDNTAKRQRSATGKAFTIEITTYTFTIYEIDCMTMNGYDILYACIHTKLGSSSSSSHQQKIRIIEPDTNKYRLKKKNDNRTSPASAKIRSKTTAQSATSSSFHDNDDQRTVDSTSVTTANDNSTTTSANNSTSNIEYGQSGVTSNIGSSSRANISTSSDIMDTLEAQQFATIAQSETIYDKLLRKYQYIVTNLSEQWHNNTGTSSRNSSDTLKTGVDQHISSCCCNHNTSVTTKSTSAVVSTDPRRSTTSGNGFDFFCCGGVEFESFCGSNEEIVGNTPSTSNVDADADAAAMNRNHLEQQQHPSSRSSKLSPLVVPKHGSSHKSNNNRIQQSIGSHQNYAKHHRHHHHHHHHAVNSSYDTTNTISTNSSRIITHMPSGLSVEAPDQESVR